MLIHLVVDASVVGFVTEFDLSSGLFYFIVSCAVHISFLLVLFYFLSNYFFSNTEFRYLFHSVFVIVFVILRISFNFCSHALFLSVSRPFYR